jgi:uncharacterized membrane-anchored protein YhcB (DUF1043 family)
LSPALFSTPLEKLRQWRGEAAQALEDLRHWSTLAQLVDTTTAARLAHLQRRLVQERLSIAFVGESGRGKTALINTLFFSDIGVRPLPETSGRQLTCPLELRCDPSKAPSLRLLPIETRGSALALREFLLEEVAWTTLPVDLSAMSRLPQAFMPLTDTRDVPFAQAAGWGLVPTDYPTHTDTQGLTLARVPRWRYAVANLPHPALKNGLTLLDLPGSAHLRAEPELIRNLVADADALVLTLDLALGIGEADMALWTDVLALSDLAREHVFVAFSKRDQLVAQFDPDKVEAEIERRALAAASRLGVARTRVFALSAREAGAGAKTDLERMAQTIADSVIRARGAAHAAAVHAETGTLLAESRHVLDSRKTVFEDSMAELSQVAAKNKRLMQTLSQRAGEESDRYRGASTVYHEFATLHATLHEELRALFDPKQSKARTATTRHQFIIGNRELVDQALDSYFAESARLLEAAVQKIVDVQGMMTRVNRAFSLDYSLKPVEVAPFSTTRFAGELGKARQRSDQDYKGGSRGFSRRETVADKWVEDVGERVDHIFEIAYRETNVWMNALTRDLEQEISHLQVQLTGRLENMQKLKEADDELKQRLAEVTANRDRVAEQRSELNEHAKRVARLLDRAGQA